MHSAHGMPNTNMLVASKYPALARNDGVWPVSLIEIRYMPMQNEAMNVPPKVNHTQQVRRDRRGQTVSSEDDPSSMQSIVGKRPGLNIQAQPAMANRSRPRATEKLLPAVGSSSVGWSI